MLEIKLNNMKQEEYKSLVYDISKYYDKNLSYEVTELDSSYMKVLLSSTYGAWTAKESIRENRSNKLKRILNG
jgi:hypothetical protein